jgi:hypothetical protein
MNRLICPCCNKEKNYYTYECLDCKCFFDIINKIIIEISFRFDNNFKMIDPSIYIPSYSKYYIRFNLINKLALCEVYDDNGYDILFSSPKINFNIVSPQNAKKILERLLNLQLFI